MNPTGSSTLIAIRPKIEFVSDSSLMVSFEGSSVLDANEKVLNLFERLQSDIRKWPVTNLHPAYQSCLIDFDLSQCDPIQLKNQIERFLNLESNGNHALGELIEIAVSYGGDQGPDLEEVAQTLGLAPDEVIDLHASVEYTVAFLGFAPGFPYLLGLPEKLKCARKKTPRLRVPIGSVAIAGAQTGIYPTASPGGWQLIGKTDEILFDPHREKPTLVKPGDRIRFVPKLSHSFKASKKIQTPKQNPKSMQGVLKVERPGFSSTVQDQGRNGWTHLGISPGGAADPVAHRVGQMLVGNSIQAASLEMTAEGGVFTFLRDTWFAVTGGNCTPELDQLPIKMWTAIPVSAGQRLETGELKQNLRSYLHVHGGFDVDAILQGKGTLTSGGWGGFEGRALQKFDVLSAGPDRQYSPCFRRCDEKIKSLYMGSELQILRVTEGPQIDWFSNESLDHFFSREFEVSNEVNRLGLRLFGPFLDYKKDFHNLEMTSEGITDGAIQVPASGQPMILFCEQRTTGGYPKIANVIQADRFRLGQLRPGQKIQFQKVDFSEAWQLNLEFEKSIMTSVSEF